MNTSNAAPISLWQLFLIFLRLGFTSFGGPIAHIGYFRDEFVQRRKWLNDQSYTDLVALCHFLPGPASSQVGIAIGFSQNKYRGAIAAWAGFTLPSALFMIACGIGLSQYQSELTAQLIHGLKVVAVAVVAHAVWGMANTICTDRLRITLMASVACIAVLVPSASMQLIIIALAAVIGQVAFKSNQAKLESSLPISINRRQGLFWLSSFFILLLTLPIITALYPNPLLELVDIFYRIGAMVFGGGHVVLPLLQSELVPTGMLSNDTFLAGYGLAQTVPGPLFTLSGFIGSAVTTGYPPSLVGLVSVIAIFVPSFFLVIGILPFWQSLRSNPKAQSALTGINVAVVGLLVAALYQPVWTSAILTPVDFALGLASFIALTVWKQAAWRVVLGCLIAHYLVLLIN